MADRNNTIAGWVLAAGIVALGGSILFGKIIHGDVPGEGKQGYVIQGVESSEGGGEAAVPLGHTCLRAPTPPKAKRPYKPSAKLATRLRPAVLQWHRSEYSMASWARRYRRIAGFAYFGALLKGVDPAMWDFEKYGQVTG